MTDEQIIEQCLASVAEYHPPCKVPEGIWAFTDRTLRSLLQRAVESKEEVMFDPHAVASVVATLSMQRDEARKLLQVALGLLSVASFQTDFEGRRCFDLEQQIRTILASSEAT
jgi:hypothetical protein